MSDAPTTPPAPVPDEASAPFFEGAAAGRLMIQHCAACDRAIAPTRPRCPWCSSAAITWRRASGRATLTTFSIVHQVLHPGLKDAVPYNVAIVELAEGVRLHTRITDVPADRELMIGMPLVVHFAGDPVPIPYFRPA